MRGATNVHASALRLAGRGILLRGPSGSGKSSLALSTLRRAGAAGMDAALVADDQVFVVPEGDRLRAFSPEAIAGLIEIRGVGILPERHVAETFIDLVVDLVPREAVERLPAGSEEAVISGIALRAVRLPARDPGFGADILVTLAASQAFWRCQDND